MRTIRSALAPLHPGALSHVLLGKWGEYVVDIFTVLEVGVRLFGVALDGRCEHGDISRFVFAIPSGGLSVRVRVDSRPGLLPIDRRALGAVSAT